MTHYREWALKRRPEGMISQDDFELRAVPEPGILQPGSIVVRNTTFLCAPTMRNWMGPPQNSLYRTIELGAAVAAPASGRVVQSHNPSFPVGSRITTISAWREIDVIDAAAQSVELIPDGLSTVDAMGIFGLNSRTAYLGMLHVGQIKGNESVLVSGAAGSTGSVAAQIAKLKGCYVVGIAGGPEKCRYLVDELGLDAAVDYRAENVEEAVRALFPGGVDVFFDNVGGEILQAAVENMAKFGRIVLCGQIAGYNSSDPVEGPRNMMRLIYGSIRMQGFLVSDFPGQMPETLRELKELVSQGRLKARPDVREGFENLPAIFGKLFTGENNGTLLAVIDEDAYRDR